jgi:hypothetical protein
VGSKGLRYMPLGTGFDFDEECATFSAFARP